MPIIERNCVDPTLLGTCRLLQRAGMPTVAQMYISFIPGRPYEKNAIAQRCSTNLNLDIDVRSCIEQDIQSARDLNVRKALNYLKTSSGNQQFR